MGLFDQRADLCRVSNARALSANLRQAARSRERTCALISGTIGMLTESSVTPSPISSGTAAGSEPSAPQSPTHLLCNEAPSTIAEMARSTAGCRPSSLRPSVGCTRSIARMYWVRSLLPIEKKSATVAKRSASMAAAGVSTMLPSSGRGETPSS